MLRLLALFCCLLPAAGYAADANSQYATALAIDLYCSTVAVVGGDIGILIGLALSAAGLIMILWNGLSFSPVVLILGGILLTAIPGFFERGLEGAASIFQSLNGQNPMGAARTGGLPTVQNIQQGGLDVCTMGDMPAPTQATPYTGGQEGLQYGGPVAGMPGFIGPATPSVAAKGITPDMSYQEALAQLESSGQYNKRGGYNNAYLGKYQLGSSAMQEAGFKDKYGNYTAKAQSYGVYSDSQFLNNLAAQEAAMNSYTNGYVKPAVSRLKSSYSTAGYSDSALAGMVHLTGEGGAQNVLKGGSAADGFGTKASTYASILNGREIK